MGIMEIKLSQLALDRISRSKFRDWTVANNFSHHLNGRIMIIWKEDLVHLDIAETMDQVIAGYL